MIKPISARSANSHPANSHTSGNSPPRLRRGFTLIELLTVVGIIVVLAALLLPMLFRARRAAVRTRMASDINAIAAVLDNYKAEFGDYPRPAGGEVGTGFVLLAEALLAPGPADAAATNSNFTSIPLTSSITSPVAGQLVRDSTTAWVALMSGTSLGTPATGNANWTSVGVIDGADGFGFRARAGSQGKVYGPYLKPDDYHPVDPNNRPLLCLSDSFGNPILYFPAARPAPNITLTDSATNAGGYVDDASLNTPTVFTHHPLYNFGDNKIILSDPSLCKGNAAPLNMMRIMLGDYGQNGAIDNQNGLSETAATTGPYLLWSAGPDGFFGFPVSATGNATADLAANKKSRANCDDVTNFTFTQ